MQIRLYLDEDIHAELANALRKRGYDVLHAQEKMKKGLTDEEQLSLAVNEGRCLLTFNVKDFVLLHNKWIKDGKNHHGILVSKQLSFNETLRRVLNFINTRNAKSLKNKLEFLPEISER